MGITIIGLGTLVLLAVLRLCFVRQSNDHFRQMIDKEIPRRLSSSPSLKSLWRVVLQGLAITVLMDRFKRRAPSGAADECRLLADESNTAYRELKSEALAAVPIAIFGVFVPLYNPHAARAAGHYRILCENCLEICQLLCVEHEDEWTSVLGCEF